MCTWGLLRSWSEVTTGQVRRGSFCVQTILLPPFFSLESPLAVSRFYINNTEL